MRRKAILVRNFQILERNIKILRCNIDNFSKKSEKWSANFGLKPIVGNLPKIDLAYKNFTELVANCKRNRKTFLKLKFIFDEMRISFETIAAMEIYKSIKFQKFEDFEKI